ncbi:MAG: metallophosphoesterase [Fuerstiella sp.]
MYDIIGDIHGHADELVELLTKLGYSQTAECFRHPQSRKVVFCGDFIDRGPHIPDVVRIAKAMVEGDAALAVMGNHEFNALAFHTRDPASPGNYLRVHNKKNVQQHSHTQNQFSAEELEESLNWFRTLPAAIDLGELRVVHACWHSADIQAIEDYSEKCGAFTPAFLKHATTKGSTLFNAIERVMKGPELPLPDGMTVEDKEGNTRHRIRIRWFDSPNRHTWATYSLPIKSHLPQTPIPTNAPAVPYADDAPPLFVGHYWLPDNEPAPLKSNIACLDYSVARHGMMCAYRFDGGTSLSKDRFVTVKSHDRGDTA